MKLLFDGHKHMKSEKQLSKVELCGTRIGAEKGEKQIRKQAHMSHSINRIFSPFDMIQSLIAT